MKTKIHFSVFPKNRQQTKLPGSNTFLVGSNHKFYIEMYLEIQVWPVQSCLSPLTVKIRENTAFKDKLIFPLYPTFCEKKLL